MKDVRALLSRLHSGGRKAPTLRLEGDGCSPIVDPTPEVIAKHLGKLRAKGPSFFCLSAEDGSYIQVAGSIRSLTIELHRVTPSGIKHVVLGRTPHAQDSITIRATTGPLSVRRSERLRLRDATMLFARFASSHNPCTGYHTRDISEEIA